MVMAKRFLAVTMSAAMAFSSAAFRSYSIVTWSSPFSYVLSKDLTSPSLLSSSILFASRKRGDGFGLSTNNDGEKQPKYSVDDKSYGRVKNDNVLDDSSMNEFFSAHIEWKPLFRSMLLGSIGSRDDDTTRAEAMASPILLTSDDSPSSEIWGIATLERRNPWRLLPSKPTSETSLRALSAFLDEWQRSLLDIPLDAIVTGDNDLHFLEEGRRTIAVTRFHVLDEHDDNDVNKEKMNTNHNNNEGVYDWKTELFRTCWSELAHLRSQECADTGSLVLLPAMRNGGGELDVVRDFVERNLIRPIRWLGRDDDWEIVVMDRGGLAVRLLYKLSDIPDLERSQKLLE